MFLVNSDETLPCPLFQAFCPVLSIVLDPHADRENPEYPWADFPFVVGDRMQIFGQIKILLDLLESKDRAKVICICDEWTDLLGFAQLESRELYNLLRNFLIRWGTGGRKFGKFLVGIGHTDNVEMWGLKGVGGLIRNFGILRLGEIATRHAEINCKHSELHQYCLQTAYPLLIEDKPTIHPTHGHYQIKENGQYPVNLQPLNFRQLTIDFAGDHPSLPSTIIDTPPDTDTNPKQWLERFYRIDFQPIDTQTQGHNQSAIACPECGSTDTKGNGFYKGQPRRRCKSCGKSWVI